MRFKEILDVYQNEKDIDSTLRAIVREEAYTKWWFLTSDILDDYVIMKVSRKLSKLNDKT